MMKQDADDGQHDSGADGVSSPAKADHDKSIAAHAQDNHPHAGHDGTQAEPHSTTKSGKSHKDL